MIRFRAFGFPVTVEPWFWLIMALIGSSFTGEATTGQIQWESLVIFVGAAFFSVLIHELGHAFTMRRFGGRDIAIALNGMGGVAMSRPNPGHPITRPKSIAISAAGPVYQIIAGLIAYAVLYTMTRAAGEPVAARLFLEPFCLVSFFWGFLNLLLPIFPLDGGHILYGILGRKRVKLTLWIGLLTCLALAIFVTTRYFSPWNLILICLLAGENIRLLKALNEQEKAD